MLQHAYDQGTVGLADDLLSSAGEDWGFDLAAVRAPVLLVYGAKDRVVTSAHGRWYRKHLPNASPRLVVVPREGTWYRSRLGTDPAARRPAARQPLRRLTGRPRSLEEGPSAGSPNS